MEAQIPRIIEGWISQCVYVVEYVLCAKKERRGRKKEKQGGVEIVKRCENKTRETREIKKSTTKGREI